MKHTSIGLVLSLITLAVLVPVTEARKSYLVKEHISDGRIEVTHPRVRSYDCEWCFFKDTNNHFCLSGNVDWKIETKTSRLN